MPKKGHSEEQIIAALKQYESGEKVGGHLPQAGGQPGHVLHVEEAVCRAGRAGAARAAAAARGERPAETAGGRSLAGPADPAGDRLKKAVKPRQRCRLARWAQEAYQIGARRSARLVRVPWSTLRYKSRKKPQEPLRRRLREIAATHVRYGYRRLTVLLKREGWKVNAKRVYRLYDEENLKVRSVERKKIARRQRVPQAQAMRPESMLVGGFRERQADGWTDHPHSDGDRSVHARMRLAGSGSLDERPQSGRGPHAGHHGTRRRAAQYDAGQRQRVCRTGDGSLGDARRRAALLHPARTDPWRMDSSKASTGGCGMNASTWNGSRRSKKRAARLASWRDHYNHRRPHSALDDRSPAVVCRVCTDSRRSASPCSIANKTNGKPRQGFASPADAALDPARRLPEDIQYQGEALLRIAQSRDSLLSLWSDFQARKTGSGGP